MRNLLPRTVWDVVLAAINAVVMALLALLLVGLVAGSLASRTTITYRALSGNVTYQAVVDHLAAVGGMALLGVLLAWLLYEGALFYRARGSIIEGGNEARLMTRRSLLRALTGGAAAGLYATLVALAFVPLARGAFIADLNPSWVLSLGLLPSFFLIAAFALAYTFTGDEANALRREVTLWEQIFLLALPLALGVLLGLLFGAAAPGAEGVFKALLAAVLTYGLVDRFTKLKGRELERALTKLLDARGAPTIKVVSEHRAKRRSS
jgi:MFS family permease